MTKTQACELTVVYEPAEADHVTARIPSVPGTISSGASQDEARENVLDALGEMLPSSCQAPRMAPPRSASTSRFQRRAVSGATSASSAEPRAGSPSIRSARMMASRGGALRSP